LAELLDGIETGKSFKCDERPPTPTEIGVVKVSAVSWGEYREQESKTCLDAARVNPGLFVRQGDFLFSRSNTIELVGACVIAQQVGFRVMLSDKILRLRFTDERMKPWVLRLLRSHQGRAQIESLASGNQDSMRNIGQERIGQIEVPLPPAAEQTRIVAKLEELLSDLDAGVAELKAAQKKLALYRQSLLKAAVQGALTAEWRTQHHLTETGTQLLARILRERRARWEAKQTLKFKEQGKTPPKDWQKKYPEPAQPDTTNLPALPQGWVWSSIGQCFHVAVGATPSRKEPSYWGGDIPWVSSGEVRFSRISDTKETITQAGIANSSTQINPRGSVMLGMIGEGKTRGQVAILNIEAANNQNCAAIWVPETDVPPEFVYAWLWSRYEDTRRGSSGNNQPALNKSLVERMPLPLPPVAEAVEISGRLESQLQAISQQEDAVERMLTQSTAQRQNILRAAFAGQLVPQDPKDEPASVLLERIRAERAARDAVKKPRGRQAKEPT
jgi:type I restriction enzyme S subunit